MTFIDNQRVSAYLSDEGLFAGKALIQEHHSFDNPIQEVILIKGALN